MLVRTDLLEMLFEFCQHLGGGIGVFFPLDIISTRITSSDDSDHDLARVWRLSEFLLLERLRMVPFHGLPFVFSPKWWT
jgi:hypothetical protein